MFAQVTYYIVWWTPAGVVMVMCFDTGVGAGMLCVVFNDGHCSYVAGCLPSRGG